MSPGSKRPEKDADGRAHDPVRIPKEPAVSQGAQVPHTQLGGKEEGKNLSGWFLGPKGVPGALGALPPFILKATPWRGLTMSIDRGD